MEGEKEKSVLTVAEFRKMTGYHDMPEAEAQETVDSLIRFAEICLDAAQNEIRREEEEKK